MFEKKNIFLLTAVSKLCFYIHVYASVSACWYVSRQKTKRTTLGVNLYTTSLKLTSWAQLASQWAPGILLSSLPKCTVCAPCLAFAQGFWVSNSGPGIYKASVVLVKPLPKHPISHCSEQQLYFPNDNNTKTFVGVHFPSLLPSIPLSPPPQTLAFLQVAETMTEALVCLPQTSEAEENLRRGKE